MNRDEIYTTLTTFLVETMDCPPAGLSENSHLVDDLEIDSLAVLELTVFTENEYGMDIEGAFKEALHRDTAVEPTVGWLVDLLHAQTAARAA